MRISGVVLAVALVACGGREPGEADSGNDQGLVVMDITECASADALAMLECNNGGSVGLYCDDVGRAAFELLANGYDTACIDQVQPADGWIDEMERLALTWEAVDACATNPNQWPVDPATYECPCEPERDGPGGDWTQEYKDCRDSH